MPTIRDIAKASGFSPGTVSRALANSHMVKEETRLRVQRVAAKLGWKPDALSSIYLEHRRSTKEPRYRATLAYVLAFADRELFSDYHQLVYKGGKQRAAELGYSLEIIWLMDLDFDMVRLGKLLKSRGIPGMVLNGGELAPDTFLGFDWESMAAASWGFSVRQPMLHQAAYHHMQGVRLMIDRIRALGYQRIGMVISEMADHFADHNILSAFSYLERHHSPEEWIKSYPLESWHSTQAERRKIGRWLQQNRPEVVIGERICWEAIEELGWAVPEDVAFVSPYWSAVWPQIGGIDNLPDVIGANAVDLVVDQLTRNERGIPIHPKVVLNGGRWMDGESIPPNAKRSPGNTFDIPVH